MSKEKAELIKAHAIYIKAQDKMDRKLYALQEVCDTEIRKLMKKHGFKGVFHPSSLNFRAGIFVKSWELGTYMVINDDSDYQEKLFLAALKKSSVTFHKKFGIKIITRSPNGEKWLTYPEEAHK